MNIRLHLLLLLMLSAVCPAMANSDTYVLENRSLARTISIENRVLRTTRIVNKLNGISVTLVTAPEFQIRLSQGTHRPETAVTLNASNFRVRKVTTSRQNTLKRLLIDLTNSDHHIAVQVIYELNQEDFYLRKRLVVTSDKLLTLERVDVEALELKDAYQPYTTREITTQAAARWNPGLGQPLYSKSGMFWGIEFPAADNQVSQQFLYAGYLWGRTIEPGQAYQAYAAVMGVAKDPDFVSDSFFEYINRIRVRPLRLQVQYNSWFDYGSKVTKESFAASVAKVHKELVTERGSRPLNAYVIDDGWQDTKADWSKKVWTVNDKFEADFASSRQAVASAKSRLGLWLSPGCLFGARAQVPKLREQGFEALDDWMSMAGPRYMQALEDRMLELTRQGAGFFKLDGLFGHLNTRNFELHGDRYGIPTMPQLGLEGLTSNDPRLSDAKFDELKIYYLTAGSERLMQVFKKIAQVDPNIYIVISNGAYLSPWWLMHVDCIWMINAGDSAEGADRTQQLVYRDQRYYDIWRIKNLQFPMSAIFNHEPKKTTTGESADTFRRYLLMNLSRGTGFVELYLKPFVLQKDDWDVLSSGLAWARKVFPTFPRVRMHGGQPQAGEVYGYTAWNQKQGYVSIHNPSDKPQSYRIKLDRNFGVLEGSQLFYLKSPLQGSLRELPRTCRFGDSLAFTLSPKEIRIIDFDTTSPGKGAQQKMIRQRGLKKSA